MKKLQLKLSSKQWFILLWLGGFFSLLAIAGLFRALLFFIQQ
ncbi:DUF2474 domain-containing protein [Acinetobacter sp. A47]|nr:DUF2474 domain-containing protein [Acinetobacter sp. A47]